MDTYNEKLATKPNATILQVVLQYRLDMRMRKRAYLHVHKTKVPLTTKLIKQDVNLYKLKLSLTEKLITQTKLNAHKCNAEELKMLSQEMRHEDTLRDTVYRLKKFQHAFVNHKMRIVSLRATRV